VSQSSPTRAGAGVAVPEADELLVSCPDAASKTTAGAADCANAVRQDFGWALGMVFRALVKSANAAASNIPGGQRGFQVLTAVTHDGPGTQLALAQQLGVDRTVLTYLLDDLEGAGLIERQPDPADRRARRVVITDAGRARRDQLLARMGQVEQHLLGTLDDAERAAFRHALQKTAAAIDDGQTENLCDVVEDVRSDC
jgi:DNA-binding MarR family transcriptional regulator